MKNTNHELQENQLKKDNRPGKDYAHYPPAATKQVKPPAGRKAGKKGEVKNSPATPPATAVVAAEGQKIVNGSHKIVNSVDESYSDGSGGGFEATEQVND